MLCLFFNNDLTKLPFYKYNSYITLHFPFFKAHYFNQFPHLFRSDGPHRPMTRPEHFSPLTKTPSTFFHSPLHIIFEQRSKLEICKCGRKYTRLVTFFYPCRIAPAKKSIHYYEGGKARWHAYDMLNDQNTLVE